MKTITLVGLLALAACSRAESQAREHVETCTQATDRGIQLDCWFNTCTRYPGTDSGELACTNFSKMCEVTSEASLMGACRHECPKVLEQSKLSDEVKKRITGWCSKAAP